jgi:Domain of unknown function (DUF4411)
VTEQLLPFYSFDTGALINGRRDIFMPKTWAGLWTRIETMIANGQIRAVDEVKLEITKKDDDAATWAKAQMGLFVPLTADIQLATKRVLAAHPKLLGIGGGPRNGADAFVIGLAIAQGGTVVTQEVPRNLDKPKIPDVCDAMGVRCLTLPHFVDEQGWTVSMQG